MSCDEQIDMAIYEGDCKRVAALLAGRDVNAGTAQDNLLRAALMGLTEAPNPKVVELLINLGVNVNSRDHYGFTPLHYAARNKSPAADPSLSTTCVKLLVAAGADVNAKDRDGITPMHRSVAFSPWNLELIEVLLAAGAKPTDDFLNFLNAIADDPEKDAVLALLAKYAPCAKTRARR
jgi:uncharacterized protein